MDTCISHDTALRWLLANPNPLASGLGRRCAASLPNHAPSRGDAPLIAAVLALDEGQPMDVLVASRGKRPQSGRYVGHIGKDPLPTGSFISLDRACKGLAIVSPELLFVEMARSHELVDLIAIGYALCSGYRLVGENGDVMTREKNDKPLTSVERLGDYLDRAGTMRGKTAARQALRHIANGSLSPRESSLAMSLSLPLNLGGYALGIVEMNRSVMVQTKTSADGRAIREARRPDVVITARRRGGELAHAAIDYDSDAHHLDAKKREKDTVRRNDFQASLGMPYFTLTTKQATDYVAFEKFVHTVRRSLGIRNRLFARAENDEERLEAIRHQQFKLWLRFLSSAAVTVGRTL